MPRGGFLQHLGLCRAQHRELRRAGVKGVDASESRPQNDLFNIAAATRRAFRCDRFKRARQANVNRHQTGNWRPIDRQLAWPVTAGSGCGGSDEVSL